MTAHKKSIHGSDVPEERIELTPEEHALAQEFHEKWDWTKNVPRLKVVQSPNGKYELYPDFKDDKGEYPSVWCGARARATGTIDENLGGLLLQQTITATTEIDPQNEEEINAICAAMAGIEPKVLSFQFISVLIQPEQVMLCLRNVAFDERSI